MLKRFPFIHNHGDFVHLDAMRDWLRGTVSLEKFLASKDDKAVVKDMTFTDEQTSVEYLDLKDKQMKEEVLCKYLTSDIFVEDAEGPGEYLKVGKIIADQDEHGENRLDFIEKASGKLRNGIILSNVPVAYDDQGSYARSKKSNHISVNNNGVTIYYDDDLSVIKTYKYLNQDSVKTMSLQNSQPIDHGYILGSAESARVDLSKLNSFRASVVGNTIIGGQVKYKFTNGVTIEPHKTYSMEVVPGKISPADYPDLKVDAYRTIPKSIRCYATGTELPNNTIAGVISTIEQSIADGSNDNNPSTNNATFVVSIYNPNDFSIDIKQMLYIY